MSCLISQYLSEKGSTENIVLLEQNYGDFINEWPAPLKGRIWAIDTEMVYRIRTGMKEF